MAVVAPVSSSSLFVRLSNQLLPRLWGKGFVCSPTYDVDRLQSLAVERTGLDDFGDRWFMQPMERLVDAVREEANLNPIGRTFAHVYFLKLLRERLWAAKWFRDFPEIDARKLAPPVAVVGPMRSGTTRLHRLLACDRRFTHLKMYETISPVPNPKVRRGGKDYRPLLAKTGLTILHKANPKTAVVHPTGPHEVEEELGLLVASAWGMKHETQWRVPSYGHWCENEDATPAYRHLARLLKLIGWMRGDDPSRPWLLKTPQHMLDLKALLNVFPDARVIFIHRDPAALVGSSCSMVWNQMLPQSDSVDPYWIGQEWQRKTHVKLDRMMSVRQTLPPERAIDVRYDDMDRDWQGSMRRIYGFLGLDMGPILPAMTEYVRNNQSEVLHAAHSYSLDTFGLRENEVRGQFGTYRERFGV